MTVDDLRRAREESVNVTYMTFMKHIREDKNGLFCFFEGNDAPYYQAQIRRVYQSNYYPISCGNKARVLKVYQLINYHRIYDKYKKGFFIDRDFDPLVNNPAIYETPCYSIENLYVSPMVFSEIIKNELQLTEVSESYKNTMNLYEKLLNEFLEGTTLFNVWYACLKDLRSQNGTETGVNLSDKLPKGFIKISLDSIEINYDFEVIKKKFPNALTISESAFNEKNNHFNQVNKSCIFRGKYGFFFMLEILEKLIEDSKTMKQFIQNKIKYNITQSQGISQFAQYAETPESLVTYLQKVTN
jgi:hypothetical protein